MGDGSRSRLLRGVAFVACILHAATALSDTTGAAAPEKKASTPASIRGGATGEAPTSKTGACQADMIEVEGTFCPFLDQICIKRPLAMSYRCSEYRSPSGDCQTGTSQKHFCIDKYEWPNKRGETPVVMKNWFEARDACQNVGKRLCTQDEWTLACEGPEHLPYPYGYTRDATACNIDKPAIQVDEKALKKPGLRDAEVARLWQGEASGSRERCVSPFGVVDMTGNVDEWTVNETGNPHRSALKGGYWSWVRGRCRAVTAGHEEDFRYYQIGWRCCANANANASANAGANANASANAGANANANANAGANANATAATVGAPAASAPPRPVAAAPTMRTPERPRTITIPAVPPVEARPREGLNGRDKGGIVVPASAAGHRIFIDERIVGSSPGTLMVDCGAHVVRIGHDGRDQSLDVPCGGRVGVSYP